MIWRKNIILKSYGTLCKYLSNFFLYKNFAAYTNCPRAYTFSCPPSLEGACNIQKLLRELSTDILFKVSQHFTKTKAPKLAILVVECVFFLIILLLLIACGCLNVIEIACRWRWQLDVANRRRCMHKRGKSLLDASHKQACNKPKRTQ